MSLLIRVPVIMRASSRCVVLLPDLSTWLGAAIIVAAGLFIAWRETRRRPNPGGARW
jgi:hypothetical protein